MGTATTDIEDSIGNGKTIRPRPSTAVGKIDHYELMRELGGGGFGCVYLARDTVSGIEFAVKGLPPEVKHSKEELENIRANFALVSRLHHPNIAAALVLHRAEKVSYANRDTMEKLRVSERDTMMVMEYARGVTLSQWRKQFPEKKVPFEKALEIVQQVAKALDYAHSEKIVHRDVKPSNVMIETKSDGSIVARVLDFGLAAEVRSSMGRVSREIRDTSGTRPYMAPEQWRGAKQGPATDQYALAAMFCELVTGEVPFASVFDTGDPVVMLTNVTTLPPVLPEELPSGCQKALLKALAKAPEGRFQSCGAFVDALAGKGPVGGVPAGRMLFAAVLLGILLLAGAGGWWWHERVKSEELRVKNEARAAERAAETEVFRLFSMAESAHTLIERETADVKAFFDAEILAFENDRRAGDDAKRLSKNIVATNFFAQALAKATALKTLIDGWKGCQIAKATTERAQKVADEMKAGTMLVARYGEAKGKVDEAARAVEAKNFERAKACYAEASKLFVALRNDIVKLTLEQANDHKSAERWQDCLALAEKVLGWESENAAAQALKREAEKVLDRGLEENTVAEAKQAEAAKRKEAERQKRLAEEAERRRDDATRRALALFADGKLAEGRQTASDGKTDDPRLVYWFAVCAEKGVGEPADEKKAADLYRRAAEAGNADAQHKWGLLCFLGRIVEKNVGEAMKWNQKAAENGNIKAQMFLAIQWDSGSVVPRNETKAEKWYRLAAENGNAVAKEWLKRKGR